MGMGAVNHTPDCRTILAWGTAIVVLVVGGIGIVSGPGVDADGRRQRRRWQGRRGSMLMGALVMRNKLRHGALRFSR